MTEFVEKQEAVDMTQRPLGTELGVLGASLAALDGADAFAVEADDPSVNPDGLVKSWHPHNGLKTNRIQDESA